MTKFNDREKVTVLKDLLSNGNKVSVSDLTDALGSSRRARRAIFVARQDGLTLEAVRDTGKAVTGYIWVNPPTTAQTAQTIETADVVVAA